MCVPVSVYSIRIEMASEGGSQENVCAYKLKGCKV